MRTFSKLALVGALLSLIAVVPPAQAKPFEWIHFGAAKYADTRESAMATKDKAFKCLGLPQGVIDLLDKETLKPGAEAHVTNGDHLIAMLSKGCVVHHNVHVAFDKPPVANMDFSAPGEKWSVTYNGNVYSVGRWDICNNWSIISIVPVSPPVPVVTRTIVIRPPPERCVDISFNAPTNGYVRWGVGSVDGPLPPSACNAQKQGDDAFSAWYGQCDVCTAAMSFLKRWLGEDVVIPHKYYYAVTSTRQTIRFSTAVLTKVVYVCLETAEHQRSCGVYMRPQDWNGRTHVPFDDSLWRFTGGNCPE